MDEQKFRPVHALLGFWVLRKLVFWVIIGGIALAVISNKSEAILWEVAIPIGLAIILMSVTYTVMYFFSIHYQLDDRYITTASGVWWKQRRSVPLEKITNLDIRQGPVERSLGYGNIWIFTPSTGGDTPEEKLIGITNSDEMKKRIIELSEASKKDLAPGAVDGSPQDARHLQVVGLLTEIRDTLQRIEKASTKSSL